MDNDNAVFRIFPYFFFIHLKIDAAIIWTQTLNNHCSYRLNLALELQLVLKIIH